MKSLETNASNDEDEERNPSRKSHEWMNKKKKNVEQHTRLFSFWCLRNKSESICIHWTLESSSWTRIYQVFCANLIAIKYNYEALRYHHCFFSSLSNLLSCGIASNHSCFFFRAVVALQTIQFLLIRRSLSIFLSL